MNGRIPGSRGDKNCQSPTENPVHASPSYNSKNVEPQQKAPHCLFILFKNLSKHIYQYFKQFRGLIAYSTANTAKALALTLSAEEISVSLGLQRDKSFIGREHHSLYMRRSRTFLCGPLSDVENPTRMRTLRGYHERFLGSALLFSGEARAGSRSVGF